MGETGVGSDRGDIADERLQARQLGAIRDLGDVIEIPLVEEELVVTKRLVVKEVIRIRKRWVTDRRMVQADLRKEDVEVIQEGDVVVNQGGTSA